jgi:uncharacterized protein (TIGR03435 family)
MRRAPIVIASLALATVALTAQTPPAPEPAFEVASVKPMDRGLPYRFSIQPGGSFSAVSVPLRNLILQAYGVPLYRTTGIPEWAAEQRYEIQARGPAGGPEGTQHVLRMLQTLLKDRFKLRVRRETQEQAIYVLRLARSDGTLGPGAKPSSLDCTQFVPGTLGTGDGRCAIVVNEKEIFSYRGRSMARLASDLEGYVSRRIEDGTGVAGIFDIELAMSDPRRPDDRPDAPATDSLFTALREQLGLRLEAGRGLVEMLVVESVERPAPD